MADTEVGGGTTPIVKVEFGSKLGGDGAAQGDIAFALQDSFVDFFSQSPNESLKPAHPLLEGLDWQQRFNDEQQKAAEDEDAQEKEQPSLRQTLIPSQSYADRIKDLVTTAEATVIKAQGQAEAEFERTKQSLIRDAEFQETIHAENIEDRLSTLPIGRSTREDASAEAELLSTKAMVSEGEQKFFEPKNVTSTTIEDVPPDPHYMNKTKTFEFRTANLKAIPFMPTQSKFGPVRKRKDGKATISKSVNPVDTTGHLMRFFRFTENPRYKRPSGEPVPFRALPPVVRFTEYAVGQPVSVKLELQNVSGILQTLRVLPPSSSYFSTSALTFPPGCKGGLVAPGMSVTVTVSFLPDTLADYEDLIVVETKQGELQLPVVAHRLPPELSLPAVIDLGNIWLGDDRDKSVPFVNNGGDGRFLVANSQEWPIHPDSSLADEMHERSSVPMGQFLGRPGQLDVPAGGNDELLFTIVNSTGEGQPESDFLLVCDNLSVLQYTVKAALHEPRLQVEDVDGEAMHLQEDLSIPNDITFSTISPGSACSRQLTVSNPCPLPITIEMACMLEVSSMTVEPAQATVSPGSQQTFTFSFKPETPSTDISEFATVISAYGLSKIKRQGPRFRLSGRAMVSTVSLSPSILNFSSKLSFGKRYKQNVELISTNDATISVEWSIPETAQPMLGISPLTATLPPHSKCSFEVAVLPRQLGPIQLQARVKTQDAESQLFTVFAQCQGPKIDIQQPDLNFGLVRAGDEKDLPLVLHNPLDISAKFNLEVVGESGMWRMSQSSGRIEPGATKNISVCLGGTRDHSVREWMRMCVEGGDDVWIGVRGDVVVPKLDFESSITDMQVCFTKVPVKTKAVLRNRTRLSTAFTADGNFYSPTLSAEHADVTISPQRGVIPPLGSVELDVVFTPSPMCPEGDFKILLGFDVQNTAVPVVLQLKGIARGLVVSYHIGDSSATAKAKAPAKNIELSKFELDGKTDVCQVFNTNFHFRNHSGVPAKYALRVVRNPSPAQFDSHFLRTKMATANTTTGATLTTQSVALISSFATTGGNVVEGDGPSAVATGGASTNRNRTARVMQSNRASAPAPGRGYKSLESSLKTKSGSVVLPWDTETSVIRGTLDSTAASRASRGRSRTLLGEPDKINSTFRSLQGRKHVATTLRDGEAALILEDGRGIAFHLDHYSGVLEPWAAVDVHVAVYSNVCGKFGDLVAVDVEGLKPTYIPITMQITGSPLSIEPATLGLLMREGQLPEVAWGSVVGGSTAPPRNLRIKNAAPYQVGMQFTIHDGVPPGEMTWCDTSVSVGADGKVGVSVVEHSAPLDENSVFNLKDDQIECHAGCACQQTVSVPRAADGSVTRYLSCSPQWNSSTADSWTAEDTPDWLSKFLFREVAPLDPLHVQLSMTGGQCMFESDCTKAIRWRVSSLVPAEHASLKRILNLSNRGKTVLTARLITEPRCFVLDELQGATALRPFGNAAAATTTVDGIQVNVSPLENLGLRLRLKLPTRHTTGKYVEDEKLTGKVSAIFSNGSIQEFPLEASISHPELVVDGSDDLDFKVVHVEGSRSLTIRIKNISHADAKWNMRHLPRVYQASSLLATVGGDKEDNPDKPEAFSFEPSEGVIPGRQWRAVPPRFVDIKVTVKPPTVGKVQSKFRVAVENGRPCELKLQAMGSVQEFDDDEGATS